MKNLVRAVEISGLAVAVIAITSPAFATVVNVPEPATMGIFAVASAGTIIARRLFRRK